MHDNTLLSRKEAAKYLGLATGTLAVWASTKKVDLPYYRIGRLAKYSKEDLDAFIEQMKVNSGNDND